MFTEFKNKFQKIRVNELLAEVISHADTHFVGDEMLVINKNMHFFEDEKFTTVLSDTALSDHYRGMAWRLHLLVFASKLALDVEGAFMECGVFRGFKSFFLLTYFGEKLSNRPFYLMDTFEGIDIKLSHGSPVSPKEHSKTRLYDFVKQRFEQFQNVEIVKGSVPGTLKQIEFQNIAFLHLDMNSYQAEIGALDTLWDNIPKGGVIVLDDFGLFSHKAQLEHELLWFNRKHQHVLEFPTGQGIVIKR